MLTSADLWSELSDKIIAFIDQHNGGSDVIGIFTDVSGNCPSDNYILCQEHWTDQNGNVSTEQVKIRSWKDAEIFLGSYKHPTEQPIPSYNTKRKSQTGANIMARQLTLIQAISESVQRYHNATGTSKADDCLRQLEKLLPNGSGIDCGTKINVESSSSQKLMLDVDYHHMDENGFYCGWHTYQLTVVPVFDGISIDGECIDNGADASRYDEETEEEYNDSEFMIESTIDYLCEMFYHELTKPIECVWNHKTKQTEYVDIELRKAQEAYKKSLQQS